MSLSHPLNASIVVVVDFQLFDSNRGDSRLGHLSKWRIPRLFYLSHGLSLVARHQLEHSNPLFVILREGFQA